MRIEELERIFMDAYEKGEGVCVEVTVPHHIKNGTEFIINKNDNVLHKLEYYAHAYDENLIHKMNNEVKIIKAFAVHDFWTTE